MTELIEHHCNEIWSRTLRLTWRFKTLLLVILLASCGNKHDVQYHHSGEIDENFIQGLGNVKENSAISIVSGGGDPVLGEALAKIILDKKLEILVGDICASSCAEYIIPAASKIHFNDSLIGYHQSPQMLQFLFNNQRPIDEKLCKYTELVDFLTSLHSDKLERSTFWADTLEMLNLQKTQFLVGGNCTEIGVKFKYQMWFPNSNQLASLFKSPTTGQLCSDSEKCWKNKIDVLFPKGTKVVVGTQNYISKGSSL